MLLWWRLLPWYFHLSWHFQEWILWMCFGCRTRCCQPTFQREPSVPEFPPNAEEDCERVQFQKCSRVYQLCWMYWWHLIMDRKAKRGWVSQNRILLRSQGQVWLESTSCLRQLTPFSWHFLLLLGVGVWLYISFATSNVYHKLKRTGFLATGLCIYGDNAYANLAIMVVPFLCTACGPRPWFLQFPSFTAADQHWMHVWNANQQVESS